MLEKLLPEHVLFVDIETVPQYENLESAPENLQKLWAKKALLIGKEGETADTLYNRAGIYAEFGKIVCISVCVRALLNIRSSSIRLRSERWPQSIKFGAPEPIDSEVHPVQSMPPVKVEAGRVSTPLI